MKKFITWFIIIGSILGIVQQLVGIVYGMVNSSPGAAYVGPLVGLIVFTGVLWFGLWCRKTADPNRNWYVALLFILQLFSLRTPDFEYMFVVGIGYFHFWDSFTLRHASSLIITPSLTAWDGTREGNVFGVNLIMLVFIVYMAYTLWPRRKPKQKLAT